MVFYLFIPFLNKLIHNMTKKEHCILVTLSIAVFSIWSNLPFVIAANGYLVWFMVIYIVSSYIRLYPGEILDKTWLWFLASLASVSFIIFRIIMCAWEGKGAGVDSEHYISFFVSLSFFLFFRSLKIGYSRIINAIASTTFGIYIIHTNSETMRNWLWIDVFNNAAFYGTRYMLPHAIGTVCIVFLNCMVIDFARQKFIEKPFMKMIDSYLLRQCHISKSV